MAIGENVKARDALFHQILRVLNDLCVAPFQDARAAGDLPDKGEIVHAVVLQQLGYAVVIDGAHEIVKAAVDGGLRAVQAAFLVIGDDLKEGGLSGCLHGRGQRFHLVLRQAYVLEAPEFDGFNVFAFLEYFRGIGHRDVVVGQHNDNVGSHCYSSCFDKFKY